MTKPYSPKISAFTDESGSEFDDQLDAAQRNQLTHIELRAVAGKSAHELSLETVIDLKNRARDAGVSFSAIGSALAKCDVDGDMAEQERMCEHLIEMAHILETPYIRIFSFHIPKERTFGDCRQQVIDNLGVLVDMVKGTGVILAHENESNIYGETAEQCLELYQTFCPTGVFKGVFDFGNFVQAGQDPFTHCWPLLKAYIEYFHIKDAQRSDKRVVPAGHGDGRLKEILSEAFSAGFSSFLTLEPHLWPRYYVGADKATRFDIAANALTDLLSSIEREI